MRFMTFGVQSASTTRSSVLYQRKGYAREHTVSVIAETRSISTRSKSRTSIRRSQRVANGVQGSSRVDADNRAISIGKLAQVTLHECFGGLDDAGFVDGAGVLVCPDVELVAVSVEVGVYNMSMNLSV